jgi:hypothetical protein
MEGSTAAGLPLLLITGLGVDARPGMLFTPLN